MKILLTSIRGIKGSGVLEACNFYGVHELKVRMKGDRNVLHLCHQVRKQLPRGHCSSNVSGFLEKQNSLIQKDFIFREG